MHEKLNLFFFLFFAVAEIKICAFLLAAFIPECLLTGQSSFSSKRCFSLSNHLSLLALHTYTWVFSPTSALYSLKSCKQISFQIFLVNVWEKYKIEKRSDEKIHRSLHWEKCIWSSTFPNSFPPMKTSIK